MSAMEADAWRFLLLLAVPMALSNAALLGSDEEGHRPLEQEALRFSSWSLLI